MRIGPYARVLLILVVLLVGISLFATDKALYYRGLYQNNPKIRVERHDAVVYGEFDPNRSAAYTCTTQEVVHSVGMVCQSPDGNVSINCTVGADPKQYFC